MERIAYALAIAGAVTIVSCTAIDTSPGAGCCSAGFDPSNPLASPLVPVRAIQQEERDYFADNSPERRAELAAIFQARREAGQ